MNPLDHTTQTTPKARGMRLTILRIMCGCRTAKAFCEAEATDLNTLTYTQWENGRNTGISKVGVKKVIARAKALGVLCTPEWLMFGIGQFPHADEHLADEAVDDHFDESIAIASEIEVFARLKQSVTLTVDDDGMAPEYQPGDIVGGIKFKKLTDALGLTCIVQLASGALCVRYVDQATLPDHFTLRCANLASQTCSTQHDVQLIMAAPVVLRRRKLSRHIVR